MWECNRAVVIGRLCVGSVRVFGGIVVRAMVRFC